MIATRLIMAGLVVVFALSMVKSFAKEPDQAKLLKQLATRVQYLEDMIAIQKLQSQYAYWLFTQNYAKIAEHCFARRADGIAVEFSDSGVYKGTEGIQRLFKAFEATKKAPGFFTLHMTANPYIEIAKDGQSAKSVWLSPGATASGGNARWVWGPYYIDYVREDGQWKIRRSVFAPLFRNEYEKSWTKATEHGTVTNSIPSKPDAPTTIYRPYDPTRIDLFKDYPQLPDPY